jgi:glycosyltransferase involved in cell wall biosynthesis
VIAFPCGSAPEVVDPGVTGFLVDSVEAASRAVDAAADLDRARVRAVFERRFSIERVARDYLSVYRSLRGPVRQVRSPEELPLTA